MDLVLGRRVGKGQKACTRKERIECRNALLVYTYAYAHAVVPCSRKDVMPRVSNVLPMVMCDSCHMVMDG